MSGELEPKRLTDAALRVERSLVQDDIARGDKSFGTMRVQSLLQHIAFQEAELEKARLAVEYAEAEWAIYEAFGRTKDADFVPLLERGEVARDAYRAAKAAAHGLPKPPTDLQGG